ncbi:MAG TPA: D-2-hydroxyacid dehydrogenase [Burkholderiales bacterium]|nr:D-2-hydroxyacid dehydrogenase [Burkholderiales bacterium]
MNGETGVLLSKRFLARFGERFAAAARAAGITPAVLHLPEEPGASLDPAACARIEIAYLTRDWRFSQGHYRAFGEALAAAPRLKWVHFASTGVDQHPFLPDLLRRGVRLTSSIGSNGEPVAQTALGGLLMLARGFPAWWRAQRRRAWAPHPPDALPRELAGQTVLVVGLGVIGSAVARFCRALGMRVIGVRRRPGRGEEPADEVHPPARLTALLARCDWVVLACTHTPETHHLMNAASLAALPRGARLINVSRGGVVEERALVAALESGHLAGAYLDVFEREPLPADSPLWSLPNVIVSPHNAQASSGNDARSAEIFLANLERFGRGEPLANEHGQAQHA